MTTKIKYYDFNPRAMALHETVVLDDTSNTLTWVSVLRVESGWVYTTHNKYNPNVSSVFVPLYRAENKIN